MAIQTMKMHFVSAFRTRLAGPRPVPAALYTQTATLAVLLTAVVPLCPGANAQGLDTAAPLVTAPAAAPAAPPPSPAPAPAMATPPGGAAALAATVNGDRILLADLNRQVSQVQASDPSLSTNDAAANEALYRIRHQLLDNLIQFKLLDQEARRRNIPIDPAEVTKSVEAVKEANNFATDADLLAWLKASGKSMSDLKSAFAENLRIQELSKELTADILVTNDDIAAYYNANPSQFVIPEGVKAHHILLAVSPDATPLQKEKVRKRALELIKELNNGADFVALARANSDDPGAKDNGGDLGAFDRGRMVKAFEDAAFAAPVGVVVGPVLTEFGYHIIRVDEKLPAGVVPLATVEEDPRVRAFLLKPKIQKRLDDEVAKLKAESDIRIFIK